MAVAAVLGLMFSGPEKSCDPDRTVAFRPEFPGDSKVYSDVVRAANLKFE